MTDVTIDSVYGKSFEQSSVTDWKVIDVDVPVTKQFAQALRGAFRSVTVDRTDKSAVGLL